MSGRCFGTCKRVTPVLERRESRGVDDDQGARLSSAVDQATEVDCSTFLTLGLCSKRASAGQPSSRRHSSFFVANTKEVLAQRKISGALHFQKDIKFVDLGQANVGTLTEYIAPSELVAYLERQPDFKDPDERRKTYRALEQLFVNDQGLAGERFYALFAREDTVNKLLVVKIFLAMMAFPFFFVACTYLIYSFPVFDDTVETNPLAARYFLMMERWLAIFGLALWDEKHRSQRRRVVVFMTLMLLGYIAAGYALCVGLWRSVEWQLSSPRASTDKNYALAGFNKGFVVETLFPAAIVTFFAGQIALCFERFQGKFSRVVQRSALAKDLTGRPLMLARPMDLKDCVVQLSIDCDGPCDSCGLLHTSDTGVTVDLLAHLMNNQEAYASRGWSLGDVVDYALTGLGAALLCMACAVVRMQHFHNYSGEKDKGIYSPWDSTVVAASQIALFIIFGMYFHQLYHIKRRFNQAIFYMLMLTNMITEDNHTFMVDNGFQRRIINLPYLPLFTAENVLCWYQLRRYVQLMGHHQVQLLEMVVVIISLALAVFLIILILIIVLGLTRFPGVHTTLMGKQALVVVFTGCILQFIYLFRVLLMGAIYNGLQCKHLSILVGAQVDILTRKGAQQSAVAPSEALLQPRQQYTQPEERQEHWLALQSISAVKKNIKYNDEFFGLFGIALDTQVVKRIIGVGVTLLISLGSLLVTYVWQKFTKG